MFLPTVLTRVWLGRESAQRLYHNMNVFYGMKGQEYVLVERNKFEIIEPEAKLRKILPAIRYVQKT